MGELIHDDSQESRILQMLAEAGGDGWISAFDLSRASLQYCARICCLRRAGHAIENKLEVIDGKRRGFYRLARSATQPPLIRDLIEQRWADPEEGATRPILKPERCWKHTLGTGSARPVPESCPQCKQIRSDLCG